MDGGYFMTYLAASKQPFSDVPPPSLHLLNAAVLFISLREELVFYNVAACRLFDHAEILAPPVALSRCLHSDSEEYHLLAEMIRERRAYRDVIVTWEQHGELLHLLVDSFPEHDASGKFLGIYVTMKDLGNFGVLDQKMQRDEKLAVIGKVAAGIAHEVRNPLTTIKGFLQVMERRSARAGDTDDKSVARMMLMEVERVDELVEELLLLARPRKVVAETCTALDLIQALQSAIELEAEIRGIDCRWNVDYHARLFVDVRMIRRVIQHLAENAMEAMDAGGQLTISLRRTDSYCEILVADTGPGIPYYQMDKIFDAFYTTKEKGTGLGLPICQRIVADHGGDIRVSSKGFGCTFSVRLPVSDGVPRIPQRPSGLC